MANWNGQYFGEQNQNHAHFGIGLGLPPAFPSNAVGGGRLNSSMDFSNSSNVSTYNPHGIREVANMQHIPFNAGTPMHAFQPPSNVFDSRGSTVNYPNTYNLSQLSMALAANSNLTATAGEFIPRSFSAQNMSTPQPQQQSALPGSVPVQRPYANNTHNNIPTPLNKRQDSRSFAPRPQSFPNRRGSFPNPRRSSANIEDSRTQDRQRLLAETAAFLTATPNQELSTEVASSLGTGKDLQRDSVESNSESRNEDHGHATREMSNTKYYSTSSSAGNVRNPGRYDSSSRRGGCNWRGRAGGAIPTEETFTSSRSYQNRYGSGFQASESSPRRKPNTQENFNDDSASQREKLSQQLSRGTLECLVCCEQIRQHEPVWSCTQCYHVLHLKCIKKWAFTSKGADSGWRCPACQNVTSKIPSQYYCFCGKVQDPDWNRQDVAHTCGEVCKKSLSSRKADCVHHCILLCHPGPCPPCAAQTKRFCGCGKMSRLVKCGGDTVLLCEAICDKVLNCNAHKCQKPCHVAECGECNEMVKQECFCGKESREVTCTQDTHSIHWYSCGNTCNKQLSCGNHTCSLTCHEGPCVDCQLMPALVKLCPCGKLDLTVERTSCLDPIPTCGQTCGKKLTCGQPNAPHDCQELCHTGPCPPCPLETLVRCRCGNMDKEIPCVELTTKADDARCTKKCTKKRACGKHRCNQMCCIELDHVCPLVCNHQLSCGRHRCEELCHRGHCKPCWRIGWEEQFCECGETVQMPPIPCGTRPPDCPQPCSRQHACEHPPQHCCHSFASCPPCSILTAKWCHGQHELRSNVPCYITEISCGLPCNKPLSCPNGHKCILPCHPGPCLKPGQKCTQPCTTPGGICGHKCGAPCHTGRCPGGQCKEMVTITCECKHRSATVPCCDQLKEYQRVAASLMASRMSDVQMGKTVSIQDLEGLNFISKINSRALECTEECKVIERNRRLAIGLQIRNPDLSAKLTPRYSEFMRGWCKKDPHFCQQVHNKLTELVQLAKQSKQKSRSYSFEPMNRDKRHFVHEYCEHFGCESEAYDPEPKRNVVATAVKEKAWLPSMSLMEVIQRENGIRKIPKPVTNFSNLNTTSSAASTGTNSATAWRRALPTPASTVVATSQVQPPEAPGTEETHAGDPQPEIDYFDFPNS